jgi:hypothetical protein
MMRLRFASSGGVGIGRMAPKRNADLQNMFELTLATKEDLPQWVVYDSS